ncbi:thiamine diphosphokinase [symbiont of Argiope bruennichi]|uniref:thiamine diphosphokinase n=1 Tax=symbiont of Argiope bruennichi TaxID=2810479 RepID=UPI003DA51D58
MNNLFIITTNKIKKKIIFDKSDFFVGVDAGCEYIIENNKNLTNNFLAIGDFDSITSKYQKQLKNYFQKIIIKSKEKNKTDLHLALDYCNKHLNCSQIKIFADGRREDHLIFALFLIAKKYALKIKQKITYFCINNIFYLLPQGTHKIEKKFFYFSIFTFSSAIISCKNCKWPLKDQKISKNYLSSISNEFTSDILHVEVKKGYIFLVQSKD